MGGRENQLVIYLDDAEYTQLKEWSETTGKSLSALGRTALLEYTDHDRLARIESRLDGFEDLLQEALSEKDSHTHKHDTKTKASETVEKTRSIAKRIQQNYTTGLETNELERAIKDIAGGDPRTVEKYKDELKDRGFAYEHPNEDSPIWFLDQEQFTTVLSKYSQQTPEPEATAKKQLREYPLSWQDVKSRFFEVVEA